MPHSMNQGPLQDCLPKGDSLANDAPQYPVCFRNSRAASAIYRVNSERARARLENTGTYPLVIGGSALLSITWFDYAESDLGAYRELSVGIIVNPTGSLLRTAAAALLLRAFTLGAFVIALPVSSEAARAAGVNHLGLPKTLLQLPLTWTSRYLDATAMDGQQRVLTMQLPLGFGPKIRVPALVVFSNLERQLLRTTVQTEFHSQIDLVGRPQLRLEAPDHPLCRELAAFDLERTKPLAVVHGPIQSASLLAPEVVSHQRSTSR